MDMRWGVRDEATDDHQTTNISLEELENCKNVSVGPSFFFLMGQKYGYRPLPTTVPGDQFECLVQVRVEHSQWSRSLQILSSDWLSITMLAPGFMPEIIYNWHFCFVFLFMT